MLDIVTSPSRNSYDVVIVGAGPGGSTLGMRLARVGLSVLTIERHAFPRFRIGESLTAVAGDQLRDLGLGEEMERRRFPNKTGVMVVGREAKSEFFVQVLSPTWQVRRAEFDQMLLHHAIAEGVEHRFGTVRDIEREHGRPVAVTYEPEGYNHGHAKPVRVECRFLVDASGHSAVLSRLGVAGPRKIDIFDRQVAVFSHFMNVERDPGAMFDNTFIFYGERFHWAWFIPLSHDAVSIGVVVPSDQYKQYGGAEELLAWGLDALNPDLTRRVQRAVKVEPVRFIANYSYRVEPFAGERWLCIGDAHRFTDPIFSFGVAMSMTEGAKAATLIRDALERDGDWREAAAEYTAYSNRAQDAIYDTIRYFWAYPAFFGLQARGDARRDIMRLLAGDCWGDEPVPALEMFRESLAKVPMPSFVEARP